MTRGVSQKSWQDHTLVARLRRRVQRRAQLQRETGESYLDETNVGGLLAEALTADVEAVLADQTSRVGADAAVSTVLAMGPCCLILSTNP